jgi:hypothetical protein
MIQSETKQENWAQSPMIEVNILTLAPFQFMHMLRPESKVVQIQKKNIFMQFFSYLDGV